MTIFDRQPEMFEEPSVRTRGVLGGVVAGICALALVLGMEPAAADETVKQAEGPLLITLGSYGVWAPRFEGARSHDISPWPIISWRNAGDKEWLDLPTDGLDIALIETDNFRAGPVGYWRWQRDTNTIAPRGFSQVGTGKTSIDLSLEAGAFAEYWPADWLRTRVELRSALLGASGLVAILSTDLVYRPDKAWTFSAGPRMSFASSRYMDSYYGVTDNQAVTSGLPAYRPDAGLRSYGVNAFAKYKISPSWTTSAFVDYQHLTGAAGDSPLITARGTPEQVMVGVGLSYTFKAPW